LTAASDFRDVLTAAVADIAEHGYRSGAQVEYWLQRIREAAERAMTPQHTMEQMLRDALTAAYRRLIDRGDIARLAPGVARFTVDRLRPQLRAELDRRILAAADLIKLNRRRSIETTLQRFQGWSTSIPYGGSEVVAKGETKTGIRKALARLPFEERRVIIDQGAKLRASISEIVATDGGAIAGIWHSHWRQRGYNFREDHKERDEQVYAVRGSWAAERGLMKASAVGYTDAITRPAEEPFCRCFYQWVFALRDLPEDMLTAKGREALEAARAVTAAA
jgi:hypothetical protein